MRFTLLPAVDVASGRAVRLTQGEAGSDTDAATADPLDAALAWQTDGAEWIHLVDLDAAFGRGSNAALLATIVDVLDVNVELAGGIIDDDSLAWAASTGCARIIIGTAALDDPAWCARAIATHGERIAIGLDVRIDSRDDGTMQHKLAARGRSSADGAGQADLWETIERLDGHGCHRYVVTDVSRDGMLQGPNVELYRAVSAATTTPVIASGGISTIDDLCTLAELAQAGATVEGSIVGKALYAGQFTLTDALHAVR